MAVITRHLDGPSLVQVRPMADRGDPEAENIAIIKSGQWLEVKGDDAEHLRVHEEFKKSETYEYATLQQQIALCTHIAAHDVKRRAGGAEPY